METSIKWPGQLQTDEWHSAYDCFLAIFPLPYISSCLAWTIGSFPSTLDHSTKYEHWQCIGVLLGTSMGYGCELKMMNFVHHSILDVDSNLLVTGYCHGRGLPPDHSDYIAHSLIHAFNHRRCREIVEPGTECIIDESMRMWKPFFPSICKIAREPQGIGIEYKNLADAETGIIHAFKISGGS